jgi:hypothetical protein
MWSVSESFPELAQAVLEHAQPDRIDIVRAKRHLLGQLGDGQPCPSSTLIASVAALLGAGPLGRPQIDLPSRDSVKVVVTADLTTLGLGPRTERSLREAIESYRRGVFLAASSLLGAAVEGAWYAAGQRMRSTAPQVDALVDGDRTAQLQGAVAATLRDALPGNRRWEADALSQFARLMRDIRNYGVHPGQVTDGDIEVYFTEDKCGLLFLEAHRHLKRLAEVTAQAVPAG